MPTPSSSSAPEGGLRAPKPVLAVAIDFGTYASGFAYAPIPQHQPQPGQPHAAPRVSLHTAWPGQPAPDPKTRTAVLYRGRTLVSWGWEAWRRWCDMGPADRVAGGYSYLESFKLLLREGGGVEQGEEDGRLNTVCPLPAGLTAVQVAADFLGAIKRYILLHLQRSRPLGPSQPCPHPDLILWCLTLPAMWGEADKARVREAAKRAGLTRTLDSPSLLLTLEPEAAAVAAAVAGTAQEAAAAAAPAGPAEALLPPTAIRLWANHTTSRIHRQPRQEQQQQHDSPSADDGMPLLRRVGGGPASASPSPSPRLCLGDTLLVVDCGGGTVDVTMHSVMAGPQGGTGPRLADAAVGTGSLCGGRFVDEALWSLLRGALGADPWDTWREEHPADWTRLRDRWELAKRGFSGEGVTSTDSDSEEEVEDSSEEAAADHDPDDDGMELPLPQSLVDALGQDRVRALQGGPLTTCRLWLRPDCRTLVVPGRLAARHVFGPVVARVVQLAAGVAAEGAEGGRPPNKVLLAGGFACSPFLQLAVRRELLPRLGRMGRTGTRGGVELVLPQHPGAAVMQGAALYGVNPSRVTARRCRLSYGVGVARLWRPADARSQLLHGYPRRIVNPEDMRAYAADTYSSFVERGQLVGADEVVAHIVSPMCRGQRAVRFKLYATEDNDAHYVDETGMRELASFLMELPQGWADCEAVRRRGTDGYPIKAEMLFGATELTLRATNPRTGEQVDTRVAWAGDAAR